MLGLRSVYKVHYLPEYNGVEYGNSFITLLNAGLLFYKYYISKEDIHDQYEELEIGPLLLEQMLKIVIMLYYWNI